MSFDVLNYSIGIQEYLYKSGFKNVRNGVTFPGDGHIAWDARIWLPPTQYAELDVVDRGVVDMLNNTYSTHYTNIFICNEPNFNVHLLDGFPLLNQTDEFLLSADRTISQRLNFIHSDFNHQELHAHMYDRYNNVNLIYFFYQGYLAYQWYRQYNMFAPFTGNFKYKYSSLSRITSKMRAYRLYLTSRLTEMDLLQHGQVSCSLMCPDTNESWVTTIMDPYCFLNTEQKDHVQTYLGDKLPLRFDKLDHEVIPNTSFEIDWIEMGKSFLHVVNETVFYENFNHLTEKTFKPIVCMRPFILTATTGSLAYLKRYGFKTFNRWIDESYDLETNNQKRVDLITEEIRKICALSYDEIQTMYDEMLPTLQHNRDLFFGSFETVVLDELVENHRFAMK